MLHVYSGKAPKGMIFDVDGAFMFFEKRNMKDPVALKLIKEIDGARYYSDYNIKTPFGPANINQLSYGCKAALLAIWSPRTMVNFTEAGENVYEALLKYANDREMHVWTNNRVMLSGKEELYLDGKKMTAFDCSGELITKSIEERDREENKL